MRAAQGSAGAHKQTVVLWRPTSTARLVERLDRAADRKALVAAVDHLSLTRSALARDGQRVNEGLERLGSETCDIDRPVVTKTITLPAAPTPRPRKQASTSPGDAQGHGIRDRDRPRVSTPASGPGVNAPAPTAQPRVNTPRPDGPGPAGGGGED